MDARVVDELAAVSDFADNSIATADGSSGRGGIEALLRPRSIAVIGVSGRASSVGHRIVANLVAGGFTGAVFPVGRHAEQVAGLRVLEHISDAPTGVDLAVIAVEAAEVNGVARECARAGVRSLVVISAGFAETGDEGRSRQRELRDIACRAGIRLIGPNCLGVVNASPDVSMHAVFVNVEARPGGLSLMTQSGAVGMTLAASANRRGIGLSCFVSVGNKADVSGNDLLEYWERDETTTVIALYLESFGNPRRFSEVARRVSASKPIVALKAGRSAGGSRAASSHTAALALPDAAVDALFEQTGVTRVDDLRELLDVAAAFSALPLPAGRRIGVVGNAGGLGILVADALDGQSCRLAAFTEATTARMSVLAPRNAAIANPVDLTAAVETAAFVSCLEAVLADPGVDGVITVHAVVDAGRVSELSDFVAAAGRAAGKPVVSVMEDPALAGCASRVGQVIVEMPDEAAKVMEKLARRHEWLSSPQEPRRPIPDAAIVRVQMMLEDARSNSSHSDWIDPVRAFALARAVGISVAAPVLVNDEEEAARAADRIGYPVSLKAANPSLVHRSDRNALRLELHDEFNVASAFDAISNQLGDDMGGAIVQPMVAPGVEMIIGLTNDPMFGPLVVVGAGGRTAELWKDTSLHLAPLIPGEAQRMIEQLRSAPLLHGFRGSQPADVGALVDALERLAQLALEVPEIAELDINPLIVHPHGAIAVDVKIKMTAPASNSPKA